MGQKLGQHFLKSEKVVRDMVVAAGISASDTVLEIGPGKGVLTKELLAHAGKVIAIEKDSKLVALLQETFADEIAAGKLELTEDDVRSFEIKNLKFEIQDYAVVANIPYYITGEIIKSFLTREDSPTSMTLLVQKEVAQRIVARDGKESILSISVKVFGEPKLVSIVKKGNFNPPPKVDSAILHIKEISKNFFEDLGDRGQDIETIEKKFFGIVRAGFSSKRRMLLNNLKPLGVTSEIFTTCELDLKVRAEDLTLDAWKRLYKAIL